MSVPTNILQQVQTYNRGHLSLLNNIYCLIGTANKRFKDFEKVQANLGSSTTFDLPPRFISTPGLVATLQPATQRFQTLTCNQSANVSYAFTAENRIFNVDKEMASYMPVFGRSAVSELASQVEIDLAKNIISGVVDQVTGLTQTNSGPYRFFGNGVLAINSYTQLQQAVTNFKNYGAVKEGIKFYLPDTAIPAIIGTGLNQFAINRNNETANSWEIGDFGTPPVKYYASNLLPIHIAGNVGNAASPSNILTVVSTNDPTGANITQITFSGATNNDANAIFTSDLLQFIDGVSGKPNLRYLTFIGHVPCAQPVQVRSLTPVGATSGGQVTINIFPALQVTSGSTQNINNNIVVGMKAQVMPSHQAGLITGGDSLFLSLPKLPTQDPFASSSDVDMESGASLRLTYGSVLGQNQLGMFNDCIWGSTLIPEYSMRVLFPLS